MVTISPVRIGNMALSIVGAKSSIESFTEESAEAQQIDLWYDYSRLQTLEQFDWSFARKRQALALHADDPPEGVWAFRYQYPVDCVSAREIVNPLGKHADAVPFEVETATDGANRSILTNLEDACLAYTFDQASTSLYSPLFVEALAHILAHHIAFALTGKRTIRSDTLQVFRALIRSAPASNANEGVGEPPRDTDWIRGRSGSTQFNRRDWGW